MSNDNKNHSFPTGKPHRSFSEVKQCKECPYRHKLVYIDKIDMGVIEIPFENDFSKSSNINNQADAEKVLRMEAKLALLNFSEKEISFYLRRMSVEEFFEDINQQFLYNKSAIPAREYKKWYKKRMDVWISGPGHPATM